MQIKSFVLAASAAATASAAACSAPTNKYFGVVAIHSGSAVQYQPFSAAKSSIFAGLNSQNASCDRPDEKSATFYIQDGALYLYAASATPQEVFVDRSGMGQGKIGYTTGAQPAPKNSERQGWAIDEQNHLQFQGKDLIACPNSIDGAWSIWADAGVANPAGNKDCVGIAARVEDVANPNSCVYTQ
ncbi:cell wall protein phiA [Aspergillus lentulus]|uniref:cell wall protein PhiA n=1 Tax=Aspergillus lentulus TaxID=293939 RepID=UPI001392F017|nr:cell wall protein phiA [Aspergillus lentulus]GFF52404.1 cell wall protein phiA [Aspergillus lentulus]GFF80024.1 cell wall protein phiA [Aspergillus lentulus]GFG07538.1 cell wall protein phiA [Aspergillus lentulus]